MGSQSRARFDAQLGPEGALLIGEADEVADKILRHSEALGGISRFTFQMNASSLPHAKLMKAIELLLVLASRPPCARNSRRLGTSRGRDAASCKSFRGGASGVQIAYFGVTISHS